MAKSLLSFFLLASIAAQAQTPLPYTNTVAAEVVYSFPAPIEQIYPASSQLFVFGGTPSVKDLWSTTGAPGNAVRVATGFVGAPTLYGVEGWKGLAQVGGNWCFNPVQAYPTGTAGRDTELWLSNGTTAGTRMLDLWPNAASANSSNPGQFVEFNNRVVFNATRAVGSSSNDRMLNQTDGTLAGTVPIGNTALGRITLNGGSVNMQDTVLYFLGNSSISSNRGLFRLRRNSTISQVAPFYDYYQLVRLGNKVLFWGQRTSGDAVGRELYVSNGTTAGTVLLKDIVPGSSYPRVVDELSLGRVSTRGNDESFQVWNNKAYFMCAVSQGATEQYTLWVTDGTTAGTIPLYTSSRIMRFVHATANGIIFCAADPSNTFRSIVYRSTGTVAGTGPMLGPLGQKFYFDDGGIYNQHCSDAAGNFYALGSYSTATGNSDMGLLITNGTAAGTRVVDVQLGGTSFLPNSGFRGFSVLNGYFYFVNGADITLYRVRLAGLLSTATAAAELQPLRISPNPAGASADVRLQLPASVGQRHVLATVEDLCGRQVQRVQLTLQANGETDLPVADLAPGVYQVRIQTDAAVYAGKLMR